MAIGVILGIILFIVAAGLFVGAYACSENGLDTGKVVCIVLAVLATISFIIVPFSFHTVNSGELAVVKNLGKITHNFLQPKFYPDFFTILFF